MPFFKGLEGVLFTNFHFVEVLRAESADEKWGNDATSGINSRDVGASGNQIVSSHINRPSPETHATDLALLGPPLTIFQQIFP